MKLEELPCCIGWQASGNETVAHAKPSRWRVLLYSRSIYLLNSREKCTSRSNPSHPSITMFPSTAFFSYFIFLCSYVSAQSTKNCPLLGPVFPPAKSAVSSKAVIAATNAFPDILRDALRKGLLDNETTSFSINVFSATTNQSLFEFHHAAPGLNGSLTKGILNADTVYRVGSVSKLFTVYSLLVSSGFAHFNEPITTYIPLLAQNATKQDILDQIQWSDITIGALASHLAGVPRDYAVLDITTEGLPLSKLGLPKLKGSEIPPCGLGLQPDLRPCSREQWLKGISTRRHAITSTFNTPIYSNAGFALLGMALENIANTSYAKVLQATLLEPLKLSSTTVVAPGNSSNSLIVPGDPFWPAPLGDETSLVFSYRIGQHKKANHDFFLELVASTAALPISQLLACLSFIPRSSPQPQRVNGSNPSRIHRIRFNQLAHHGR